MKAKPKQAKPALVAMPTPPLRASRQAEMARIEAEILQTLKFVEVLIDRRKQLRGEL